MKRYLNECLLAIIAGVSISIGCIVFISLCGNSLGAKIVGSIMFAIGLYTIVLNKLFLYTGKVGYLLYENPKYILTLIVTWFGNFVGTFTAAKLMTYTKYGKDLRTATLSICESKVNQTLLSAFILSILCGLLMFIAVDGYRSYGSSTILLLCVSVFILCGFEHCVANMFYFSMSGMLNAVSLKYLIVMTAGNSVGGMVIPFVKKHFN